MTAEEIAAYFTRQDGRYVFARWGRPVVPVVFGVEDATLGVIKGAIEALAVLAGHTTGETDPELGANMMFFFIRDWDELVAVRDLDRLVPDLAPLVERLKAAEASQYRFFRFDKTGAIKAGFVFLRMQGALADLPADVLALGQAVHLMLLWGEAAFAARSPLVVAPEGTVILRPDIAALIRAAYDRTMPAAADDAAHALRLLARMPAEATPPMEPRH